MSGGAFDYNQYQIGEIADQIEEVIKKNGEPDIEFGYDYGYNYSEKTIAEFKKGVEYLRLAQIYAHRIDWLLSGDDGEETFHEYLREDLAELEGL